MCDKRHDESRAAPWALPTLWTGVDFVSKSDLEATFAFQLRALGAPEPEREYAFALEAMGRRWRFDFAWPDKMVAAEVEGGVWSRGRHTRGSGFVADCEKYNAATLLGWRVLRIPTPMVDDWSGAEMVREMLEGGDDE